MILFISGTNIFNETFVKSQAELMWSKMDSEVQKVYTKSYFDKKVEVMRSYMNKYAVLLIMLTQHLNNYNIFAVELQTSLQ